jgi:hypothetical protein
MDRATPSLMQGDGRELQQGMDRPVLLLGLGAFRPIWQRARFQVSSVKARKNRLHVFLFMRLSADRDDVAAAHQGVCVCMGLFFGQSAADQRAYDATRKTAGDCAAERNGEPPGSNKRTDARNGECGQASQKARSGADARPNFRPNLRLSR